MGVKGFEKIVTDNGDTFYHLKASRILSDLPLLKLKECRCRQLVDDLCKVGLLKRHNGNQSLKKPYIAKGDNYQYLEFDAAKQLDKKLSSDPDDLIKNYQVEPKNDEKVVSLDKKLSIPLDKKLSRNYNTNTEVSIQIQEIAVSPYQKFLEWVTDNSPRVLKMAEPITESQFLKLIVDFKDQREMMKETLCAMHNTKGLTKDYVSANLTLRNWMKRRIENPIVSKNGFNQQVNTQHKIVI